MDTKTFLGKLLDERDNYVLYLARGSSKWNENYATLDETCDAIARHDASTTTVYFAVGKFANNLVISDKTGRLHAKRTKEFASRFKTLACDIDIGPDHKYQTQREAAVDILRACGAIRLPQPMFVSSGVGVHLYWPLTESINADLWERVSILLRTALQAHGVAIDASKIHDKSMVLRPAGSHHKKDPANWRLVDVAKDASPSDPRDLLKVLIQYKSVAVLQAKPAGAKRVSQVAAAILEGGTPIHLDDLRKCKQIDALIASGGRLDAAGRVVKEPMWRASAGGIAKFCTDPQDALIRLAGGHPDFDLDENLDKMSKYKGTGPTNCSTFEANCPEGCIGCQFHGKLTSPGQLTGGITEVVIPHPMTGVPVEIKLPHRYALKNGAVVYTPQGSDEDVFVSPYMMYVVARFTDVEESRSTAKVAVTFPIEGVKIIDVDVSAIATGGAELTKALALKQVYTYGDNKLLRQYFMTYLQELQKARAIEYYYKHYGWQNDGSFLGHDGLIGQPPSSHIHLDGSAQQYQDQGYLEKKGDLAAWVKGTRMFAHPDLEHHGTVFLMMAGSVLMKGSGLASVFVNMYSKESGTGKTLTARYGLSVYGSPERLISTVNDTDNALYKRFGILSSTGAYIDEITTMDMERLRKLIFTLQEGREKDRLQQSAEGFRDCAHWTMPIFGSSNKDIIEGIGNNYSSEAEKLRVLQFTFNRVDLFETGGSNLGYKVSRFLSDNHGLAGPLLVEEIIRRGGPKAVYERAFDRFSSKYNFEFTGPERFIQSQFVSADGIGEIAADLKLIEFAYEDNIARSLKSVSGMRNVIREGELSDLDLIMQFLTENADKLVHYREARLKTGTKQFILEPAPRTAVGRTEVAYDDNSNLIGGNLFVNRLLFKQWCQRHGADYRAVLTGLMKQGVAAQDNVRKTLFKGVPGASSAGQTYCMALDLNSHPRLIEANSSMDNALLAVTPRLSAVI